MSSCAAVRLLIGMRGFIATDVDQKFLGTVTVELWLSVRRKLVKAHRSLKGKESGPSRVSTHRFSGT
jgi:hypothetical protein